MSIPTSIMTGALIIAATVAVVLRWSLMTGPTIGETTDNPIPGIYRLDRWTGSVTWCKGALPSLLTPSALNCDAK